jgi:hypothetical protein
LLGLPFFFFFFFFLREQKHILVRFHARISNGSDRLLLAAEKSRRKNGSIHL